MRRLNLLLPLGMAGALVYAFMILWGQAQRPDYDPMSTYISFLTAEGAPNGALLHAIDALHGALTLLFVGGVYTIAERRFRRLTRAGCTGLLLMSLLAAVGFGVCPMRMNEEFFSAWNMAHFYMTFAVVGSTIISVLVLGIGLIRRERLPALGWLCIGFGILIAACSLATLLTMWLWPWRIGLVQRLMVFSIQAFLFALSAALTFGGCRPQRTPR